MQAPRGASFSPHSLQLLVLLCRYPQTPAQPPITPSLLCPVPPAVSQLSVGTSDFPSTPQCFTFVSHEFHFLYFTLFLPFIKITFLSLVPERLLSLLSAACFSSGFSFLITHCVKSSTIATDKAQQSFLCSLQNLTSDALLP